MDRNSYAVAWCNTNWLCEVHTHHRKHCVTFLTVCSYCILYLRDNSVLVMTSIRWLRNHKVLFFMVAGGSSSFTVWLTDLWVRQFLLIISSIERQRRCCSFRLVLLCSCSVLWTSAGLATWLPRMMFSSCPSTSWYFVRVFSWSLPTLLHSHMSWELCQASVTASSSALLQPPLCYHQYIVMSEPLSMTPRTGTPASSTSICCWRLPPYRVRTCK